MARCLHVYMLTCLQALGLTPMLARHRGRDSVLHCGGSDGAPADALPHLDGGTLNPAVAGFQREFAVVFAALWWCALVVLVRERCGSVWWCACVGSLWCGVPVGVPLCCGALLVLVGGPSAVGLSRSGTPGAWAWWLHLLGCAPGVVRYWVAGSPTPLECETYSVVCLGLRPAGALVPSCAGAAAWCPYFWGAPHRGATWATPVSAGVGEPKGKA